jgi:hypothetical protein
MHLKKRMIKGTCTLLFSSIVFLFTFLPARVLAQSAENIYVNEVYRWSVKYPSTWNVDGGDPTLVKIVSPDKTTPAVIGIHSISGVFDRDIDDVLNFILENMRKELALRGSSIVISSRNPLPLREHLSGRQVIFEILPGRMSRVVIIAHNNTAVVLNAETYMGAWSKLEPYFDEVFSSFAFSTGNVGLNNDLLTASLHGDTQEVSRLIERGADVNARDSDGVTALMGAAIDGNTELARVLIEKGADVDSQAENGWTALHIAAINGDLDVARILIEKGANVNEDDQHGETPLMLSVFEGNTVILKFLIEKDANVNAEDKAGSTALQFAVGNRQKEIVEILKSAGAR